MPPENLPNAKANVQPLVHALRSRFPRTRIRLIGGLGNQVPLRLEQIGQSWMRIQRSR